MTDHYDRLGLAPTATPEEVKAAYHAKLKEFPAHSHPDDFKAIRTAYEAIRKGGSAEADDFFKIRPLDITLAPELKQQLRDRVLQHLELSVDDLIRETF